MVRFRRWMALPMALTALALLWLASRLGGNGFAVDRAARRAGDTAGLRCWLAGRGQRPGPPVALRRLPLGCRLGCGGWLLLPRVVAAREPAARRRAWLPAAARSARTALAEARASGKPVFAYFTADWCLTCKVNEQRRDRTRRNPRCLRKGRRRRAARRLDAARSRDHPLPDRAGRGGRAALCVVSRPRRPHPAQLPQVLTPFWTCNGFVPVTYLIKPPWLRRRAG
jgi:hypothetical protein